MLNAMPLLLLLLQKEKHIQKIYACGPYMILKHVVSKLLSTQKTLLTQTDLSVNTQEEM